MSALFPYRPRRKISKRRTARRQYLVLHLHRAGPRPLLELLLEIEGGGDLDATLERYAAIPTEVYHALGADQLPACTLTIIRGGRR
jgi:hypothetical protein